MKHQDGVFHRTKNHEVILNSHDRDFVIEFQASLTDFGIRHITTRVFNGTGTAYYVEVTKAEHMIARAFRHGYCYGSGSLKISDTFKCEKCGESLSDGLHTFCDSCQRIETSYATGEIR